MLSLLSRIVNGGDSENCPTFKGDDHAYATNSGSSSVTGDTDEEFVNNPTPVIIIDQTELAQEALDIEKNNSQISSNKTNLYVDAKDDLAFEEKTVERVPVVIPSRDVCRRIIELIEYYLSDENLVKDMFLLKHVTKHREGYVSLKLLTSYKKLKRLTKDWRVVAYSLKSSKMLELNSDGTKARRRSPLPQELEEDTRPFRTLLATHISQERANMNQLAEFFGKFGEMISLQVHKPGGRTLNEVRQAERQHPGIVSTVCAMVEYEKVHCARQALRCINNNTEECKMQVMELPRKKHENLLDVKKVDVESAYYSNSDLSEPPSPLYRGRPPLQKLKTPSSSLASSPTVSPVTKRRSGKVSSSPESSPPSPYRSLRGPPSPCSSPDELPPPKSFTSYDHHPFFQRYEVPGSLPLPRRQLPRQIPESKFDSPSMRRRNHPNHLESTPMALSPWLLRRRILAKGNDNISVTSSSPSNSPSLRRRMDSSMFLPENVTRFPRGPDGTKGFTFRRSTLIQTKA